MSSNHLVSSLVSSINNARAVKKPYITLPSSKLLLGILNVLIEEGFVSSFQEVEERKNVKVLKIALKYVRGKTSIQNIEVVSKPGKRIYSSPNIVPYYDGLGFYIFSTSKGIMTDFSARSLNVGGEILCKVF